MNIFFTGWPEGGAPPSHVTEDSVFTAATWFRAIFRTFSVQIQEALLPPKYASKNAHYGVSNVSHCPAVDDGVDGVIKENKGRREPVQNVNSHIFACFYLKYYVDKVSRQVKNPKCEIDRVLWADFRRLAIFTTSLFCETCCTWARICVLWRLAVKHIL